MMIAAMSAWLVEQILRQILRSHALSLVKVVKSCLEHRPFD
jgi:hypothetical protein